MIKINNYLILLNDIFNIDLDFFLTYKIFFKTKLSNEKN